MESFVKRLKFKVQVLSGVRRASESHMTQDKKQQVDKPCPI